MLKIFMTGDNHIGLKYAKFGEKAAFLSEKRISAFKNMVKKANDEECGLFVITGDLFENISGIAKKDVTTLLSILSEFNGTVAVLPGNHDYYDEEAKIWKDFKAASDSCHNILLLNEYKPYTVSVGDDEVILYPAFCTSKHSEPGENNLGWIKDEAIVPDKTYRIGISHGAVEGETIDNEGRYFLMTKKELEEIPVDAWLIGHTHVSFPNNLTEEISACDRIFNAGSHVQPDVATNTEGSCFIIEIDEDKKVKAKKFLSGNIRFYRPEIKVSAGKMEEVLERELSAYDDESVIDGMVLSGTADKDEYEDRREIIENSLSRFVSGSYDDSALSRLISKELIDSEFAETSFSAAVLSALLEEPKEAQLVYELLGELKGGKRK
ncbi:MAG: metallophosphoesterase [Oscillospiraceae bacterium]|nr:metallophosphoesterase [Oscillospiraceae bacterium]